MVIRIDSDTKAKRAFNLQTKRSEEKRQTVWMSETEKVISSIAFIERKGLRLKRYQETEVASLIKR